MRKLDSKRKPKQEVIEYINNWGLFVLQDFEYENQKTKIHLEDGNGYRYFTSYSVIYNCFERGSELSRFSKTNPYIIYNIDIWMKSLNYLSQIVGGEYVDETSNTLNLVCEKGHSFGSSFQKIRASSNKNRSGCTFCSGRSVIFETSFGGNFPELINQWSDKNDISPYEVSWGNSTIKFLWKCFNGHKDYPCTVANKKEGKGCPSCGGKLTDENNLLVSNHPVLSEWDYSENGDPSNYALYSNEKVGWICGKCGNKYPSTICNRTLHGNGCPDCASSSEGEDSIFDVLSSWGFVKNEDFIQQKRFPDCRDKNPLPFDFYLPPYNLCIEFHGIQHYRPQKYFGGDKKFEDQQKKDNIKMKYCSDKNISLLVIPYWEFDNIEQILERTFFE